jgi:hypothetical protein
VPSAAITDDGCLVTCFAGCPRTELKAALDALGFIDDDSQTQIIVRDDDTAKRIQKAQEDWAFSGKLIRPIDVEFVEWYLHDYRGITLPIPHVLRRATLTAIIVCVQRLDGAVTAVHIKSIDGRRLTRGWMGTGAVQLFPPRNGELGLAEGVESAMSATQLFGVPCWATLGAGRLAAIDLPRGLHRVHLFPDNDDAGRAAAARAQRHYSNQRLPVRTWWPPEGLDWNDVLKGSQP